MSDLITSQKYLDGELSAKEKLEFEEQLNIYTALSDEILLIKEINETLSDTKLQNFEHKVRSLMIGQSEYQKTNITQRPLFKLLMAAGIALIIGAFGYLINFNSKTNNDTLFAEYYEKYDPGVLKRSGATSEDTFSRALNSYANADYKLAYQLFKTVNSENATPNYISLYYCGLCQMELGHYQNAISLFNQIPDQQPFIKTHCDWYLALSYIKTSNFMQSKELLMKIAGSEGYYQNKAAELLSEIKD